MGRNKARNESLYSTYGEVALTWRRSDGGEVQMKPDLIGYSPGNDEYYAFEVPHPEARDKEGTSLKKMYTNLTMSHLIK